MRADFESSNCRASRTSRIPSLGTPGPFWNDKSCKPEYFEDQDDFSRTLVEHLDVSALDEAAMSEGAKKRESETSLGERLGHRPADHLFEAGLTGPPVQTATRGTLRRAT